MAEDVGGWQVEKEWVVMIGVGFQPDCVRSYQDSY